ncbi:Peroxisomal biogenesis factor 11 (PEX11) [Seminavis robusta]|uniref:Peroxisomal biogenesis factor 11 (PEX11) n=1 Tax=Seminavis robusta TaxID=568900 RepID=A0A9N8HG17_9STRA|nr:Peroxisomal biogenesis factor 11 (PEX11) [Seminavis robusta]|eukprot:Sro376_g129860.1 Peroxisomal biogenesis factor 11 (PEX11) (282) ;mRNA; f:65085-65930
MTDGCRSPDSSSSPPLMVEHPSNDNNMTLDTRSFLDRFLQGYTKFMSPGINQDRGIKLLQYTLWMISYYYKDKTVLRDALRKLCNELSFARYVLRLLQLPPALEAARSGSWSYNPKGQILGKILAWTMIGYYPLEHAAYVQWQTPKLLFPKTAGPSRLAEQLSAWSCRCWFAYIVTEILQCFLELRKHKNQLNQLEHKKKTDDDDEEDDGTARVSIQSTRATMQNLRLQIVRDLLFALPAIHWSLPNWDTQPWLSDPLVNTLMWVESVVCMYQSVASFQRQ